MNQNSIKNCKFFAGDWASFNDHLTNNLNEHNKFDYIFTSETIYNIDNYPKICNIFRSLLKRTGIMYPFINLYVDISDYVIVQQILLVHTETYLDWNYSPVDYGI